MQPVKRRAECVSNLVLDEWLAEELGDGDRERVAQHVQACAECSARRDQRVQGATAFLAAAPSFEAHARQLNRADAVRPKVRSRGAVIGALTALTAVAAGALLWLAPPRENEHGERSKGAPHIGYFVKREARVMRGVATAPLRAGDLLRFTYSIDRPAYLALFDLDARGARVYFPPGAAAGRVAPGNDVALDFSVELDDAPGEEQVFAVFCERVFALEPVRKGLAVTRRSPELPGCRTDVVTLMKEPAP